MTIFKVVIAALLAIAAAKYGLPVLKHFTG
jgi:anthranilate phosphoribosyltransferase